MFKLVFLASVIAFSYNSIACTEDGREGIAPKNNLWIDSEVKSLNGMDEAKFNEVIDTVEDVYRPIIEAEGARFKVNRYWSNGTVNASASRSWGRWIINMYGGLARHEKVTADGFALVVCHEIGHHIGGAPKKTRRAGRNGTQKRWATNEGQADYWATLKCLRKVWRGDDHSSILSNIVVPEIVKTNCESQFSNLEDRLICQRAALAGHSISTLFQDLRNQTTIPDFSTPSEDEVSQTMHGHPGTQCRLDTYFQGALCGQSEEIDVDQEDPRVGNCNRVDGDPLGVRPLCWYKPL
ncbi:MAG: hypothetical protein CME65_02970 [Halobacteriovoraceae bacterium]|nr:hypothetical protein [Halobacteriovoraceae bacterium]|tara:strand:- start:13176 stop:14060 length:885 start_codon:yes stop_codon:yes gene_type:complete